MGDQHSEVVGNDRWAAGLTPNRCAHRPRKIGKPSTKARQPVVHDFSLARRFFTRRLSPGLLPFTAALVVSTLVGCASSTDDVAGTTTTEPPLATVAPTTTTEPPTTTTTTVPPPTTTEQLPERRSVPHIRWRQYDDAEDMLQEVDLSPVVVGLDAQEASPEDDWVVVGASSADRYGNVGVTVASPDQLDGGVRVDLASENTLLYASIRKARQDVWAFARLVGDDAVESATRCAQAVKDAIDQDDLVVLCYVYTNRDQYLAEERDAEADSASGLVCAQAYSTVGPGDEEPYGQDLGSLVGIDPGCPTGVPDETGAGIEGVPLPPGAVAVVSDEDGAGGPADADARSYTLPESSFGDVVAFYDTFMPTGSAWHDWSWCEERRSGSSVQRAWVDLDRSGSGLLQVALGVDEGDPFVVVTRFGSCSAASG